MSDSWVFNQGFPASYLPHDKRVCPLQETLVRKSLMVLIRLISRFETPYDYGFRNHLTIAQEFIHRYLSHAECGINWSPTLPIRQPRIRTRRSITLSPTQLPIPPNSTLLYHVAQRPQVPSLSHSTIPTPDIKKHYCPWKPPRRFRILHL